MTPFRLTQEKPTKPVLIVYFDDQSWSRPFAGATYRREDGALWFTGRNPEKGEISERVNDLTGKWMVLEEREFGLISETALSGPNDPERKQRCSACGCVPGEGGDRYRVKQIVLGRRQSCELFRLPETARIYQAAFDWRQDALVMYVRDRSFPELEGGQPIPVFERPAAAPAAELEPEVGITREVNDIAPDSAESVYPTGNVSRPSVDLTEPAQVDSSDYLYVVTNVEFDKERCALSFTREKIKVPK